jgi:thiol:disulfide interchange protein DsbG
MNSTLSRRLVLAAAVLAPLASFATGEAVPAAVWQHLEASHWIADGSAKAPRVVYVFTDANCPYCTKFWDDTRPWVDSGKVQLRHLLVGIIAPTSPGKAAALLTEPNPAAALANYERVQLGQAKQTIASGDPQPLHGGALRPLQAIPPAIRAEIDANQALMKSLHIPGTPGVVWRDAQGAVHTTMGGREDDLAAMLGPR